MISRSSRAMTFRLLACTAALSLSLLLSPALSAGDVESRPITIWSDTTRMAGDLWFPRGAKQSERRPGVVLTLGWGGTRGMLNGELAPKLAAAGFYVLTFDYRGWGGSDGKLVASGESPLRGGGGEVTLRVRVVRNVVNPFDQVEDIRAALDYLRGEPGVDPERIGLWGTSYGGGHVVFVAGHDERIKAVVSQVGFHDSRTSAKRRYADRGGLDFTRKRASQKARGEIGPMPPDEDRISGLGGWPDIARMGDYQPIAFAASIRAPILIIDAEHEDLFDRMEHGHAVYQIVRKNVPAAYHTFPGRHYDVYGQYFDEAADLTLAWFKTHLMGN